MNFRSVIVLTSFLCISVAPAISSRAMAQANAAGRSAIAADTVTGEITAVTDSQLTISVERNKKVDQMSFRLDQETRVDGKIRPGATVRIDYKSEGPNLVALRVTVISTSGLSQK